MTAALLIENLQALPNKELLVMVYNESTGQLDHVVLAEHEDTSEVYGTGPIPLGKSIGNGSLTVIGESCQLSDKPPKGCKPKRPRRPQFVIRLFTDPNDI